MINVTRSSMPSFEEYCEEIHELWDSHWLTNMGVKHRQFEAKLKEFLNCEHVSLYTNGHLALENAIAAMEFTPGSEVITTPYTFASTTHAITRNHLVPVFCDIRLDNYTIDASKIEALITEKTVAIIPVHVYGNICDIEAIDEIAKRNNLKVIYDAAHTFGAKYRGISTANYGDASIFSFHATKVFNTIEGGTACFQNDELVDRMNDLKNFGIHGPESVPFVGGNAKMSEFQAAMGICNLRSISNVIANRKSVVEHYNKRLSGVEGLKLNVVQPDVEPNYAYYPVVFDGYRKTRDEVYSELRGNDIYARKYFYPITNGFECYKDYPTAGVDKTPNAQYVSERVLTLPLYPELELEMVDRICDIILG